MIIRSFSHSQKSAKSGSESSTSSSSRLTSARRIHHEMCSMLLGSLEALKAVGDELAELMPEGEGGYASRLSWPGAAAAGRDARMENLSDMAKVRGKTDEE